MALLQTRCLTLLALTCGVALETTSVVAAQCSKPPVPVQGLQVTTFGDIPFTFSDGYKTLVELSLPTQAPPSCGWPLVVFVHGYGLKRTTHPSFAARGFAVLSYDVRGQGSAQSLNPSNVGLTLYGVTEKFDLAEVIAFAKAKWSTVLRQDKLAVWGGSQGGVHAWFAAVHSGQTLVHPTRGSLRFPSVDVVITENFVTDWNDHLIRGRHLFGLDAFERVVALPEATIDPTYRARYLSQFYAQDADGLLRFLENEAGRAVRPLLSTSRVPTVCMVAHLDELQTARELMPAVATLPASTPFTLIASTVGHASPDNWYESGLRGEHRIRWLDRYLWGVNNNAGNEARYIFGVLPSTRSELNDVRALWAQRHDASYPAPDVSAERWYPTASLGLSPVRGAAASTSIDHRVASGFDPVTFAADPKQRTTSGILAKIPLASRVFATPAFAQARELGGSPRVALRVTPSAARFQLAALLFAKLPGQERMLISSWGAGVVKATPQTAIDLDFELSPCFFVLPVGASLELEVRNHWLREAPMSRSFVTVPYFVDCNTTLHVGGSAPTSLDLPFRRELRPSLRMSALWMDAAQPYDFGLDIDAAAHRAGRAYVTLASLSGQSPGIALPGGTLPLYFDPVTDLFLQVSNSAFLPGFVGVLDANGRARATARFTQAALFLPGLVGARFTFATWVFDQLPMLNGAATPPRDLFLR